MDPKRQPAVEFNKFKKALNYYILIQISLESLFSYFSGQSGSDEKPPCLSAQSGQNTEHHEVIDAKDFIAVIARQIYTNGHVEYGANALKANRKE